MYLSKHHCSISFAAFIQNFIPLHICAGNWTMRWTNTVKWTTFFCWMLWVLFEDSDSESSCHGCCCVLLLLLSLPNELVFSHLCDCPICSNPHSLLSKFSGFIEFFYMYSLFPLITCSLRWLLPTVIIIVGWFCLMTLNASCCLSVDVRRSCLHSGVNKERRTVTLD